MWVVPTVSLLAGFLHQIPPSPKAHPKFLRGKAVLPRPFTPILGCVHHGGIGTAQALPAMLSWILHSVSLSLPHDLGLRRFRSVEPAHGIQPFNIVMGCHCIIPLFLSHGPIGFLGLSLLSLQLFRSISEPMVC